ncbi:NADH:ubiquinone oxidoreductase [Exophiala sideris]|uniref:NADH:ubiquinone oxidoreductase n=1 Tax=Exophiala sideris TaxID=1016849 RepID=A0ABR0JSW1_9EURO|nr:NADH:ubiquinone oxidoreductase [Exophiala sideris]KAK5068519.1 NADH:ubiquinone oxidoreductase [Exophiala sideris]KAK5186117.1 NADH:ubiquinone oxidoreductase [Eurotiomycetes sp. CCFEE 6388]
MPSSDGVPSSPPGPGTSLEDSLKYYKAQYEQLEADLADFQSSSKELEAELEKDIEASEKRERQLKDKAANLQYEVDEWKAKYRQSKTEASNVQNALQKEITELRDTNRTLTMRLRDIEVANDDFERKQRNTESSLEDMESKYNQIIERSVLLEDELRTGEQERESLRIEAQRLRDELSDLKIETDITKEKLRKAVENSTRRQKNLTLQPITLSTSPRSELSPTTTNASSPTFDTPPTKTASSSGLSDTPTPPSPPISDRSATASKPLATPGLSKPQMSMTNGGIQRPATAASTARPKGHSLSKPLPQRTAGLSQSASLMHIRNLRGKMQKLEERVINARSRLPAPVNTPPKVSPRPGSALGVNIPSSVTVRSRKGVRNSSVNGSESLPEPKAQDTPSQRPKPSRLSLSQHQQQPASPTRGEMPPPRPSSRASGISGRSSFAPGHSRPGSRASVSGFRTPLGGGLGSKFAPNATTDAVRPKSSLSSYGSGYDGALDEDDELAVNPWDTPGAAAAATTPTPRRTTFSKRTSDVGTAIPSPTKRASLGGVQSKVGPGRRQSSGFARPSTAEMRPPSRQLNHVQEGRPSSRQLNHVQEGRPLSRQLNHVQEGRPSSRQLTHGQEARPSSRQLNHVQEGYDLNETF